MLIDSHVHLNDRRYLDSYRDIAAAFKADGIEAVINVAFDRASAETAVSQAKELDGVYAALAVHPHDSKDYTDKDGGWFLSQSKEKKVVAIGEIGLDYHYDLSPREVQRAVFIKQLEVAAAAALPVIIHLREAAADMLDILKKHKTLLKNGIVLHCFSESPEYMREVLRLGAYISFAGPLTFKNARMAVECAKEVPNDRFLIETDCPYLTPEPHRGKINMPAYVRFVAEKLAEIRGVRFEELAAQSVRNTKALFTKIK